MTDAAAALTYYALLSLFPALLFGVALLGLVSEQGLITDAADYLRDSGAPPETVNAVTSALDTARSSDGTALTALLIGLVTSLYGASGAFGAAGRALNRVWRVEEGRSFIRLKLDSMGWTLVTIALGLTTLVLVLLGGGLARDVLGWIGLPDGLADAWLIVRWPLALLSAMLVYAVVYFAAPNVRMTRFEWISPGSVVGVALWILGSFGFSLYVSNFGSYNATYGAFAAVVILLVWLWLSSITLVFGAEVNAAVKLRKTPGLGPDFSGPPLPVKVPAED